MAITDPRYTPTLVPPLWNITLDRGLASVLSQSVLATEYVRIWVQATKNGAVYNPTTATVAVAFTLGGVDPVTADWTAGAWETDTDVPGTPSTRYYVVLLVGPGTSGKVLAEGIWSVWVKITDSPEIPVRNVGTLTIN